MTTDTDPAGFGWHLPGYDFFKQLGFQAGALPQDKPGAGPWVLPPLKPEDLDKRIQELRAVHFWLEQNAKAIAATLQALEVQKMTLATLQGMNVNLEEALAAFRVQPGAAGGGSPEAGASGRSSVAPDPLQWWNALAQQFQAVAGHAVRDMTAAMPPTEPVARQASGQRGRRSGTAGSTGAARTTAAKTRSTGRRPPG